MTVAKLSRTWLLTVALLAGCDRGSDTAGIDGTGAPVLAYGSVTGLGSVWVNDVRYDTSSATITIDGQAGAEADIEVGDIVLVAGRPHPLNPTRFVADRVTVDDAVEGPIAAIDEATNTLVVLGQTVRITPTTVFDEAMQEPSLAGLTLGDTVEVAGLRGSNGDIIATRLEPKANGGAFETTGIVAALDDAEHRLSIGALIVDFATLAPSAVPAGLHAGEIVEVKGSVLLPGGELVATSIARTSVVSGGAGDRVDIEGYVTSLDTQAPQTFTVAGVPTRITNDTVVSGVSVVLDAKVAVKGSLDSAGTVVASTVGVAPRNGPVPPSGSYSVVGQLFAAGNGVVANAPINLWIQTPGFGYSYWWANGALYSNGSGEFTASNLPVSAISIHAGHGAWVQPCAFGVPVPSTGYVQIELIRGSAFDSPNPPRPQLVSGATLTGTVFETVNGVRQPVPGALIWAYTEIEVDLASTRTDLNGGFFFCNLPGSVVLYVSKEGFELEQLAAAGAGSLDIEIHRN